MADVSTISGYGFSIKGIEAEKILLFAFKHRDAVNGLYEDLDKILSFYDFYEDVLKGKSDEEILNILSLDKNQYSLVLENTEDWCSGMPGFGSIPATVISKETGVRVGYECDDYNEVVLFYNCMPWEFNDVEKDLTKDSLKELLLKYMEELNIPEIFYGYYNLVMY